MADANPKGESAQSKDKSLDTNFHKMLEFDGAISAAFYQAQVTKQFSLDEAFSSATDEARVTLNAYEFAVGQLIQRVEEVFVEYAEEVAK